ncbi:MAG: hypothetical protein AB1556_00980 [Bacillota bacterium]
MYQRTNSVVENYKQLRKDNQYQTPEYGLKTLLTTFTLHDVLLFEMLEEEFGTPKAVELYARLWSKRALYEFKDLKAHFGLKEEDPVDMPTLLKMIKKYFDDFGNPFIIAKQTDDYIEGHAVDCPYTTEVVWNTFPKEKADHFNDSVQIACNHAIFETFLKLAGLDKEWLFGFPAQLCRGAKHCTFTFTKKQSEG